MAKKIDRRNVEDIIALTPMQEGMLFHYLKEPERGHYFEQLCLELSGIVDIDLFQHAWTHVTQTNEMLRTVYRWEDVKTPVQIILKDHSPDIHIRDVSGKNPEDARKLLDEIQRQDRETHFDLGEVSFRVTLCQLPDQNYAMIVSNHHILYDGWSLGILLQEFFEAYQHLSKAIAFSPPVKNRFKEFVKWIHRQDKCWQEAYWKNYLTGYDTKTILPLRNGDMRDQSENVCNFTCSREFSTEIKAFAKVRKITLAAIFYTTWGLLLQRYTNSTDVVFGVTLSGRNVPISGIERMVGLFINTLPLRIKASNGDQTVEDLLYQVNQTLREWEAYEHTSLAEIKTYSAIPGRHVLFDSIVVIENYPLTRSFTNNGGFFVNGYSMFERPHYNLTLCIVPDDPLKITLSFNPTLFSREFIENLGKHFINMLTSIVTTNGAADLRRIEMLTEPEKRQILHTFNNTSAEYPEEKTIHQLFEEQVERTPDKIAIVDEERQVTYRDLNAQANRLARLLREKGVQPTAIVAIMVTRSLKMVVGILGILKAGGAYLPIDPDIPEKRVRYMLKDSGAVMLLTHAALRENLLFAGEIIHLDDETLSTSAHLPQSVPEECLRPSSASSDLAYLMYTSGSTGTPKGVMVEHSAVVNILCALEKDYPLLESDAYLLKTTYTFDVSVTELFGWFIGKGKLVILGNGLEKEPKKIVETIKKHHVTHINFAPSVFRTFLDVLDENDITSLQTLKYIFVAGEAMSSELARRFEQLRTGVALENIYGPTECTIYATRYPLGKLGDQCAVPIGNPFPNLQTYVVDSANNLQPVGVPGELWIGGVGVARGYVNKPDLTDQTFIANPFCPLPSGLTDTGRTVSRLYKTGDLARWLPDGNLEFLGRIDHQVKIRGFRIEPGEIESYLLQHKAVKEAVVVARDAAHGENYLCAYVVLKKEVKIVELRDHLSRYVPEYMMPSSFVRLDSLPLTPSGKIDRKALPIPEEKNPEGEFVAPRNDVEAKLGEIWQSVLHIERLIGITENFFELGGHSLKAISLVSRIHKELRTEISLQEIFKTPTIQGLAHAIANTANSLYASIQPLAPQAAYPLSAAQKRLFMLHQLEPDGVSYNMPAVMIVEGKLDIERFERVFQQLLDRHEAFRTGFRMIDGEPAQEILNRCKFRLETGKLEDAEDLPQLIRDFVRPFDLSKAPLLRVKLVQVASHAALRLRDCSEKRRAAYLILTDMHHIISDGVSINILIEEFTKLYHGETLPQLHIQYKDYAAWQNDLLASGRLDQRKAYWLERFHGELSVLNVLPDFPRPAVQSFEGDRVSFHIDRVLTEALKKLAGEYHASLYMVLLAAYNVLLYKYTGQQDIMVGTPLSGRRHADLEPIIGMFVNTVVMRNFPAPEKTFADFLQEVRENALQAYEHQDYPFEDLVDQLNISRDLSRNPVFDTMFAFQNMAVGSIKLEGVTLARYEFGNPIAKFDLTMIAVDGENGIAGTLEYCSKLFKKDTIERLCHHFLNVVREIVKEPAMLLRDIDILSEREKCQLLYAFNDTAAEYPGDKTIQRLFEERVEKTPQNIAVMTDEEQITYQELNARSNQLARVLREKGVQPETLVGIMADHSIEMIIGILAILKAGGAYLPLASDYPVARIQYILKDSNVQLVLTTTDLSGAFFEKEGAEDRLLVRDIILLDEKTWYAGDDANLPLINTVPDLAYVMYTSGSTGKPKGVMVEQRGVVNYITWAAKQYVKGEAVNFPLYTSISFDLTVTSVFTPLLTGNAIVIYRGGEKELLIKRILEDNKVAVVKLTPAHLKILGDKSWFQSTIRRFIVGGEELPQALAQHTAENFPETLEIYNEYGPTETVVGCMIYQFDPACDAAGKTVPIGVPADNVRIYVLNRDLQPTPPGVAGELYIAGDGLARGYWRRPDLTGERFIPNPFHEGRMYKTGDLARQLPEGTIEFLGRMDSQVKLRGFRIELAEIEHQLLKDAAVKEAVVVAQEDPQGEKYLCAYLVSEKPLAIPDLRERLSQRLPAYMIPSDFIQLEHIPLTPNGKLDREALPTLERVAEGIWAAPRNELEGRLGDLWQEVLNAARPIGITENFFALGGNSLKAISLVARIHKALGVEVPLQEVFKTPTIRDLARYIAATAITRYTAIAPAPSRPYYPLSSAQKRMFILQQFDPDSVHYNVPFVCVIEGRLEISQLERAFQQLLLRHEAFRTRFHIRDGEPVQEIVAQCELRIESETLEDADSLDQFIRKFMRPFDLSQAPLLRVSVAHVAPAAAQKLAHCQEAERFTDNSEDPRPVRLLCMDMPHIISDGVSTGILIEEVLKLYHGEQLPPLRIQYKDYAVWQQELLAQETLDEQKTYWEKQFAGELPVLHLPTDFPRPAVQSFKGFSFTVPLNLELTEQLKELARTQQASLYMTLLAAYNAFLARYTGQEDIIVGSPISGRNHADLEPVIGICVNTLALRNFPTPEKTFRAFLHDVKARTLQAYHHQDYPFEELVDHIEIHRDLSRNPLFDTMLVFQNMAIRAVKLEELTITPYPFENPTTKFDVTVTAVETENGLALTFQYNTELFQRETMERFSQHFVNLLQAIVSEPDVRLGDIELLSEPEKRRLLCEFNATTVEYPQKKTIRQLFEEQVKRTPNHTAVVGHGTSLCYKDLDTKATQLAALLQSKGGEWNSRKQHVVGILVEPSIETMIAILGVLKAGAAYLPIDPDYPDARIAFMLQDSGACALFEQHNYREAMSFAGEIINLHDHTIYQGNDNYYPPQDTGTDLVYMIYTSGTTGKPKGVLIENHSLINYVNWFSRTAAITANDSAMLLSSLCFDLGYTGVYPVLLNGGELHIPPKGTVLLNPEKILQDICTHQITYLKLTPSLFNMLIHTPRFTSERFCESVRLLVLGGEPIHVRDIEWFHRLYPRARLMNHYGPTEATIGCIATLIDFDTFEIYKKRPVLGKPINNTKVYILDSNLKLVPIGVSGEIHIGGAGLARGYLNQQDLTVRKFITHAFNQHPPERLYKTGDLGRFSADGAIEFLGRKDSQVKIRGFRVELAEIEQALIRHEDIQEAVIISIPGKRETRGREKGEQSSAADSLLCAYVVAEKDIELESLRNYLQTKLPSYMLPSYVLQIEKIPVTANGKLNTSALPDPLASFFTKEHAYEPPRTETEKTIANIWQEVLDLDEDIDRQQNFFDLGGHSLKAVTVISRMYKELNLQFPLTEFFKNPTISGIANYIENTAKSLYTEIEPVPERAWYPLSSSQKRMYFFHRFDEEATNYNLPFAFLLEGKLNLEKLHESFRQLIRRHELLRTGIEEIDGEPVQKVYQEVPFTIPCRRATWNALECVIKNFVRPFDLASPPLIRVELVTLFDPAQAVEHGSVSPEQYLLLIDRHHIISDIVSRAILMKDFSDLYNGHSLPDLRIQYKDFAVWQNALYATEAIERQQQFWLNTLEGEIPVLHLPTDYPRPAIQSFEGKMASFEIGAELTQKVRDLAAHTGTTLYMTLLAVYNVLLFKYTGQDDIIVGTPMAGRRCPDLQPVIGMFVNTLAMRNFPEPLKQFDVFLQEVKERCLQAFEHQDYQFDDLVEHLQIPNDPSRNPVFDTMFAFEHADNSVLELDDLTVTPYAFEHPISNFDLMVYCLDTGNRIQIMAQYASKLFAPDTIERLMTHFVNLLQAVVYAPATLLKDIQMLSAEEERQILWEFNNISADFPQEKTFHQLFEDQVEKTPDQPAVVYHHVGHTEVVTYRQLNENANRLARLLKTIGFGKEDLAGILLHRSPRMIETILAIWKAGGAYIPLDPQYPEQRVLQILQDSKAKALLTQTEYLTLNAEQLQCAILVLDHCDGDLRHQSGANVNIPIAPNNLAYVIYTSGSTGKPKGAMVEHIGMLNHLYAKIHDLHITAQSVIAQNASHTFDISVWQCFAALLVGGKTVIYPNETVLNPEQFLLDLEHDHITILEVVPSYLAAMLEILDSHQHPLETLDYLMVTGEEVKVALVKRWFEIYPHIKMVNAYGPTEASDDITHHVLETVPETSLVPIGKPLRNFHIYIVDDAMKLCPIGVKGEICVSGIGVGRGYLHDEEKTAAVFREDPFVEEKGRRLYKTGDLGCWRPDGTIMFFGRKDYQVKIRGHRIELGEIEQVLLTHSDIKDVIVTVNADPHGEHALCAYIVSERAFEPPELRTYLSQHLPKYMLPAFFVRLEKLPLTPNGKINRKALPAPENAASTEWLAPRNELEAMLAGIWQEILTLERPVGVTENFFELGGHSLLATQLVSRLNALFQITLPLRKIFEAATIAELSVVVLQYQAEQADRDELDSVLRQLEQLSENEVQAMLT